MKKLKIVLVFIPIVTLALGFMLGQRYVPDSLYFDDGNLYTTNEIEILYRGDIEKIVHVSEQVTVHDTIISGEIKRLELKEIEEILNALPEHPVPVKKKKLEILNESTVRVIFIDEEGEGYVYNVSESGEARRVIVTGKFYSIE